MLRVQIAQRYQLVHVSRAPLISLRTRNARRISGHILSTFRNMSTSTETSIAPCNEKSNPSRNFTRPYQVVVAATRDMGIGKDGKLPWTLPSDLKYFKEVTTTTSSATKRNAVIMGRKTWESIPQKYRPLPGRLNVVLSHSGKIGLAALEDLVLCSDLDSAFKILAEPPLSLSIETVFVIGGGQVLEETLNAPGCEAIHLTDIKTSIECDTFIPRIDSSAFFQLLSSREMVENNIRFSFVTYVRTSSSSEETPSSEISTMFSSETDANKFDYLKQIQERITSSDR